MSENFRTVVCHKCGVRISAKSFDKHLDSKKCRERQAANEAETFEWVPLAFDVARTLKEPWFEGRVKVTKDLDSVGVKLKHLTPPPVTWWVEAWFGTYYNALYKIVRDKSTVLNMMYEPIFRTDDRETRIAILEMILMRVRDLYKDK